jgi:FkbM family methyltransferase
MKRLINFLKQRYTPRGARYSFTRGGEDLIISEALEHFGVKQPYYIDVGAHHPIYENNTYLFYKRGSNGIIVEPNTELCALARQKRPRDIILNAGAGRTDTSADFYSFPQSTRNTFSKEQAEEWQKKSGQKFTEISLPIYSLNTIILTHCQGKMPDLISIDAEGYDLEILNGFSWNVRLKVFCIESIMGKRGGLCFKRNKEIYNLFEKHNYLAYAETSANTIFIDTIG